MSISEIIFGAISEIWYLVLGVSGGSFPRRLTSEEEAACLERLQKGDASARAELIEHNLRLVAHICSKYTTGSCSPDDMLSIGTIGLIKAVDTFSSERGSRFSSYASRCIENECLMFLRSSKKSAQDVSISEPIELDKHGNELTLLDVIADDDSFADRLEYQQDLRQLRRLLAAAPDTREMRVLRLRYGLDGSPPLTQKKIAASMGISRSYISRLETRALQWLKDEFSRLES